MVRPGFFPCWLCGRLSRLSPCGFFSVSFFFIPVGALDDFLPEIFFEFVSANLMTSPLWLFLILFVSAHYAYFVSAHILCRVLVFFILSALLTTLLEFVQIVLWFFCSFLSAHFMTSPLWLFLNLFRVGTFRMFCVRAFSIFFMSVSSVRVLQDVLNKVCFE
jgi:hypothetical protein